MKRFVALLLTLGLALGLVGCGKSDEVKAVESLIGAIGDVTIDSEPLIQTAQTAYDALSEKDKESVDNYTVLENANNALNQLYANAVVDLINAIGTVNVSSADTIAAAINAYDCLTEEQKELVTNHSALIDAASIWTEKYAITGNYYACTSWEVTNKDYKDITSANSTFISILGEKDKSYIQISDNYDKLLFVNLYGTYIADIEVKKDDYGKNLRYEAVSIDWEETPTVIEGHEVTFSELGFYVNTGIARLNFVLDGGEKTNNMQGNINSAEDPIVVFQEFEVFVP